MRVSRACQRSASAGPSGSASLDRLTEGVILCRQLYLLIHGKPEMKNPKLAGLTQGLDRLNHKFDKRMDDALAELPQIEAAGDAALDEVHAHNQARLADFAEVKQFVADLQEVAKSNGGPTLHASEPQQELHDAKQPEVTAEPVVPFAKTA